MPNKDVIFEEPEFLLKDDICAVGDNVWTKKKKKDPWVFATVKQIRKDTPNRYYVVNAFHRFWTSFIDKVTISSHKSGKKKIVKQPLGPTPKKEILGMANHFSDQFGHQGMFI